MQPVRIGFPWRFLYFEPLKGTVLCEYGCGTARVAEDNLQESCPFHLGTQLGLAGLVAGTLTY